MQCVVMCIHTRPVLPFVVELWLSMPGGINKEGMQFFKMRRDAADSKRNARVSDLSSWSSKGISNIFLQSPSLANLNSVPLSYRLVVT